MYKEKKNNGHEKYINKTFNIKKKKNPLKKKKERIILPLNTELSNFMVT